MLLLHTVMPGAKCRIGRGTEATCVFDANSHWGLAFSTEIFIIENSKKLQTHVIDACGCTLCLSWQVHRWQTFLVRFHFAACFDARPHFCLLQGIEVPIKSSDTPFGLIVSVRGLHPS